MESLFDILSLSNHNEARGLCESGQQETGWSSHLIEGPSKLHWLMQQKPRSRIIQVMAGSKGPGVITVLADNNTGDFRAGDKRLGN